MRQQTGVFVGRRSELGILDAAFGRAAGEKLPQLITIVGPAGIGKTALIDAWLTLRGASAGRVVRVTAAAPRPDGPPQARAGRGVLLDRVLRARFGLDGLPADAAMLRLRQGLQELFGDRRVTDMAALLGRLVGLDPLETPLARALAGRPDQAIELARAVFARCLEEDAAAAPLVVVAEDLDETDDASLADCAQVWRELGRAPVVVLATGRPELIVRRPTWPGTRIELGPLGHAEVDALVRELLAGAAPPDSLVERTAAESGGNPHLLAELVAAYRAHGLLAETETGWRFDAEEGVRPHVVMSGEHAAETRVAALSAAERDVLARGATFGGVFWTGGVVALGRLDVEPPDPAAVFAPDPIITYVQRTLESLCARDYLRRIDDGGIPEEAAWGFRHALEQRLIGSACDPDTVRRRKAFAAQWLESRGGEQREQRLEALAALYEDAGDKRRAAYCYITAAAFARDRLMLDRAHVLYLEGVRRLGADDAVAKMDALYAAGDVAARLGRTPEALGLFQDMLRLAWRLDMPAKGGAAHGRIGRLCGMVGDNGRARAHLELARKLFEVAGDGAGVAASLDDMGRVHFVAGAPERSLECHRAALAVREQLGDERGRALTLSRIGQVLHETGDLQQAAQHFRSALDLRRRLADRQGVVASLMDLGALERDLGHHAEALAVLDEARELARTGGERLFECSVSIEIGDCQLRAGRPRAALDEFKAARKIARQFGAKTFVSEATRGIAEAELAMGEAGRARDDARAAYEMAETAGAPPLAGAALRVIASSVGAGAAGEADLGGAREMFDRAVEILTTAGAELELARTLDAYADYESRSGRDETAVELRRQSSRIVGRGSRRSPVELGG